MYAQSPHSPSTAQRILRLWRALQTRRSLIFAGILIAALLAFELFNYTTTDFALTDLLGDVGFAGLRWATILAIAFCGMDFAGIARLFTPDQAHGNKTEVWYLLGAWFLAAGMNALLTWWGVSLALLNHAHLGNEILSREALLNIVPVFVAALVVLIRILVIGTFTMAGDRLLAQAAEPRPIANRMTQPPAPKAAPRPVSRAEDDPPLFPDDWEADFDRRSQPAAEPSRAAPPPRMPARPTPPPAAVIRPAPKPAPKPLTTPADPSSAPWTEVNGHNHAEPR